MFPSYFLKSLLFIVVIVGLTITGIMVTGQKSQSEMVRNGYIPILPGQGRLIALNHVMAQDSVLENAILELGRRNVMQHFSDYSTTDYLVSTILLRWTNSHLVASDARGPLVDGRIVDFLEKAGYLIDFPNIVTTPEKAKEVRTSWYNAFQMYKAKLLLQTSAKEIFMGGASYDLQTDKIYVSGDLSLRFIDELIEVISYSDNPKGTYGNYLVFVRFTKGLDRLLPDEKEMLRRMRNVAEGRASIN